MKSTLFTIGGKAPEALLIVTPDGKVKGKKPRKMTKAEAATLGGNARAKALPAKRRQEIARKAANARWSRPPQPTTGGTQNDR